MHCVCHAGTKQSGQSEHPEHSAGQIEFEGFCFAVFQSPPSKKRKLDKPRKPITFLVLASTTKELALKASSMGMDEVEGIAVVAMWIKKILNDLKV